jgi:hypothetical protein
MARRERLPPNTAAYGLDDSAPNGHGCDWVTIDGFKVMGGRTNGVKLIVEPAANTTVRVSHLVISAHRLMPAPLQNLHVLFG